MGRYHDQTFPNENSDYRAARDALLTEELELRRQAEKVSAMRRALPLGGALKEDYVFQDLSGEAIRLSELFSPKSSDLLIYSFMYKPGGEACPVCTSLLDGLNGSGPHIKQNLNFVIAEQPVESAERGRWQGLGRGAESLVGGEELVEPDPLVLRPNHL